MDTRVRDRETRVGAVDFTAVFGGGDVDDDPIVVGIGVSE